MTFVVEWAWPHSPTWNRTKPRDAAGTDEAVARIGRMGYRVRVRDEAGDTQEVLPCARCGWDQACGDPPGEDCHS